jgi:beta-xylosidase
VYLVKAKDPAGPWTDPVLVLPGKGIIDPCPFWDTDGQAYLAHGWAASRAGINSVLTLRRLSADGTRTLDAGRHVFSGHDFHHTVEGPKLYRRNGYYYIFAPAGGVATGWQLILRSRNIYGPYEEKVVLEQGKTGINGPHQGAYVETPKGEPWFLHFQDKGPYGRVLHLQPVKWVADWPQMGADQDGNGVGEPVLAYRKPDVGKSYPLHTPAESEEFNTGALGLQWQWQANPKVMWSALLPGTGFLRLFAYPLPQGAANLWPVPNLLLQKFPGAAFTATTKMEMNIEWGVWQGKKAGLLVMGNDYGYLSIIKNEKGFRVAQVMCQDAFQDGAEAIVEEQPLKTGTAYLRVTVSRPDATCSFSYSEDGQHFKPIGKSFKALPDKWIGAKVGLFAVAQPGIRAGGYADVDWFRITKD